MDRMKAISAILLLSVTLGAGSCARFRQGGTQMFCSLGWLGSALHGHRGLAADRRADRGRGTSKTASCTREGEHGGWLATLRPYDDFRLSLEFRVPPGGNSGVFIRSPLEGDPAYTGMEIQILDDYAEQWRGLNPYQYTASIYDVQAPSERATKDAGQVAEDGHHRPGTRRSKSFSTVRR